MQKKFGGRLSFGLGSVRACSALTEPKPNNRPPKLFCDLFASAANPVSGPLTNMLLMVDGPPTNTLLMIDGPLTNTLLMGDGPRTDKAYQKAMMMYDDIWLINS